MRLRVSSLGIICTHPAGHSTLGPALPALEGFLGESALRWRPQRWHARPGGGTAESLDGITIDVTARTVDGESIAVGAQATNSSSQPLRIERFDILATNFVRIGADRREWRMYRNGYQSWSGTHTLAMTERDPDFAPRFARVGSTDARHRAPSDAGHIRSDALSAICEPDSDDAVAIAHTSLDKAFGFVELDARGISDPRLSFWVDLDGLTLQPGESTETFHLIIAYRHGEGAGGRALRAAAEAAGRAMHARSTDRPHPGGWCSWYYYFEKVTEADVRSNLEVLAKDGRNGAQFGCEYLMVDDGHQSEIGDWLTTNRTKFPSGMKTLANAIRSKGFDTGIWWAPFFAASKSRLATEHPEWLVRHPNGRAIVGLINPAWGWTNPMYVLDTTHPEALAYIRRVADAIAHDWGYQIQKIDFLYAAALPGVRSNPQATRAESLRAGLEAVRAGAGEEGFILGCGCPLGPAIGVVDAMRIGADVTPHWSDWISRNILLNTHGLATRHAVVNTLTRSVFDGVWWLNDPDCLMVRDTDTKLNVEEVRTLSTVFGMTNGMVILSDDMTKVPPERVAMIRQSRAFTGGLPEVVDLFREREPGILISRHPERCDIAAINIGDTSVRRRIRLAELRMDWGDTELSELWTGRSVQLRDGVIDFGEVPAHGVRVVSLPANDEAGSPTSRLGAPL